MAVGTRWGKTKDELLRSLASAAGQFDASDLLTEVVPLLSHQDEQVVAAALEALGNSGEEGSFHMGTVAHHLDSASPLIRSAAAGALGLFGRASMAHAGKLAKLAKGSGEAEMVRAASLVALGHIEAEDHVDGIAAALDDASVVVVCAACQALGLLGNTTDEHIDGIAKRLEVPATRYAAVTAIADLGERAASRCAEQIARTCLQDKDSMTRSVAASALGNVAYSGTLPQQIVDNLRGLLKSEHVGVRCSAALAFGYMGEQGAEYAAEVASLLSDKAEDTSEVHLHV